MSHKMVIVARQDLGLSKGKLAAQVGHAAVDCALKAMRYNKRDFEAWHGAGQKKTVLKVKGEKEFYPLKAAAEAAGLSTALIKDAGHTEIPAGTITVLGIGPGSEATVDKVTGHLSLL
ncbi:MAG: peptidyl-tRNA hydrolase Pth2 [Thermoplasmatota archaeon]